VPAPGAVGCDGDEGQGEPAELAAGCDGEDGHGEAEAGAEGWVGEFGHGEVCALARPAGASSTAASERARAQIISFLPEPVENTGRSTICPAADKNP
jgi:hypothetical protein